MKRGGVLFSEENDYEGQSITRVILMEISIYDKEL